MTSAIIERQRRKEGTTCLSHWTMNNNVNHHGRNYRGLVDARRFGDRDTQNMGGPVFFRISRRVIYFFILSRSVSFQTFTHTQTHTHTSDVSSYDAYCSISSMEISAVLRCLRGKLRCNRSRDVKARSLGAHLFSSILSFSPICSLLV